MPQTQQRRRWFQVIVTAATFAACCVWDAPSCSADDRPPNILWMFGEGLGPDLGAYGARPVETPNLDRLAAEGVRFAYAFTTAPIGSVSRSAMMTGMYQHAIGAHQHGTADKQTLLPEPVTPFPLLLQKAGYFCGLMGRKLSGLSSKLDLNFRHTPDQLFPAGESPGGDWREAGDRPFFVQLTYTNTHRPWHHHPERFIDPAQVVVPPYFPDTPLVRRDIANGLEEVQLLDSYVGRLLARLDREGLTDNTLVICLGDSGRAQVRGQQFLYDDGARVPLIMRWPGRIPPGSVNEELVSAIDVTATVLAAAGVDVPPWMQGADLLAANRRPRDYVITARDKMDDTHDAMRALRDTRFKYILNLMPERAYCQLNEDNEQQYPILALLNVMHMRGQLNEVQDRFMQPTKPAEELYDLAADPYETKNLATVPAWAGKLQEMRHALDAWRKQVGDQGVTEEFRQGGLPGIYPTRTLEDWETKLSEWNGALLGAAAK